MKKTLFALITTISCGYADSFINNFEYGEMLYKNPRGIGCDKCHGKYGEGSTLGSYTKNKKLIKIVAPNISKTTAIDIKTSLKQNRKRSVMPEYFLTDSEVEALAYYLKKINQK